jgi:hypothetical protein
LIANLNVSHYLSGGQCFGPFIARNLTPDANGLPEGLTDAEFVKAWMKLLSAPTVSRGKEQTGWPEGAVQGERNLGDPRQPPAVSASATISRCSILVSTASCALAISLDCRSSEA